MDTLCTSSEPNLEGDEVKEVEDYDGEKEEEEEEEEKVEGEMQDQSVSGIDERHHGESETHKEPGPGEKKNAWKPNFYSAVSREQHCFAGYTIDIRESLDSYGAVVWPAAVALCQYLDNNREEFSLLDKSVLEIGAGTGLLSILACLLGAWVTATDLPDILGNLRCNLSRNTRGHCRYTPQVAALSWGQGLEQSFPRSVYRYDYVLAADVVYHHDFLDELLLTMQHFCQPGTRLIWANKVRFQSDLRFLDNFKRAFNTTLLAELPQEDVRIFMAQSRE